MNLNLGGLIGLNVPGPKHNHNNKPNPNPKPNKSNNKHPRHDKAPGRKKLTPGRKGKIRNRQGGTRKEPSFPEADEGSSDPAEEIKRLKKALKAAKAKAKRPKPDGEVEDSSGAIDVPSPDEQKKNKKKKPSMPVLLKPLPVPEGINPKRDGVPALIMPIDKGKEESGSGETTLMPGEGPG